MAVEGHYTAWTIAAGEDLDDFTPGTGAIFKAVALDDGKLANNGREAGGIMIYGGHVGEHVTLAYAGIVKFTAGENIGVGRHLTVRDYGFFYEAKPGDWIVGRCLDTPVSAGSVGTGAFNFASSSPMPKE